MLKKLFQRGDTLIEVMFAVTVFSMVAVGALAIMNQGTAAAQRSIEITLARSQVNAQAETLRFMHDSYLAVYQPGITFAASDTSSAAQWYKMIRSTAMVSSASNFTQTGTTCPAAPSTAFVIDPRNVLFLQGTNYLQPAETYAQLSHESEAATARLVAARGLWVEAVRSQASTDPRQANAGYIDFHIRACWESPGQDAPLTVGTIVRLYEPR